MLSGFLFAHGYLSRNKVLTLRSYAQRRFARLYPMHLFSLVVFVLVYWLIDGGLPSYADGTLTSFVSHLFMMHGIGLNPHGLTWNYPSWAISVELWVGAAAFFLVSAGLRLRVLLSISLVCLLVMYLAVGNLSGTYQNISGFLNAGLLRGLSAFLLGIMSYAIFLRYRKTVWSRFESNRLEMLILLAILLVVFGRTDVVSKLDFFAPFLFMTGIAVFATENGYLSALVAQLSGWSMLSYSIYLNQAMMIMVVERIFSQYNDNPIFPLLTYLSMLIFYSYMTHYLVERPARAFLSIRHQRNMSVCPKRNI